MSIKKENISKAPTKICSIEKVNKHHKKLVEKRKVHEYVSIFKTLKPDVPYVFILGGPILISAPHTLPVDRFTETGVFKCRHKREKYAAEIALKIAYELKQ